MYANKHFTENATETRWNGQGHKDTAVAQCTHAEKTSAETPYLNIVILQGGGGVLFAVFAHARIVDLDVIVSERAVLVAGHTAGRKSVRQRQRTAARVKFSIHTL